MKRLYERFYLRYRPDFFTGDVTNSGLHAAFFTFLIRGISDSYRDLYPYLKLNLCIKKLRGLSTGDRVLAALLNFWDFFFFAKARQNLVVPKISKN